MRDAGLAITRAARCVRTSWSVGLPDDGSLAWRHPNGRPETIGLCLIGLPALALGTWAGLRTFGKLDEAGFRRVVMVLLFLSGLSLVLLGR